MLSSIITLALLALAAFGAWQSLGVLFARGRRKRKALFALASLCGVVALAVALAQALTLEAKQAGFANVAAYQASRAEKREEAARAAAKEKAERERKEARVAEEAKKREALACRQDLQCWGDKAALIAGFRCKEPVEKSAKFDFEWTDGLLEPKFSHFRWKDKGSGIVTVFGDKIKMQNGFGAWEHMLYSCDVNPETEQVSGFTIQPGRL